MKKPNEPRILAAAAACALTLALGCDPDAIERVADQAREEAAEYTSAEQDRIVDALERANSRIDMAAREALASAEDVGRDVAGDIEGEKDAFVTASRERLRQLQLEMEQIHAGTDRRIEELDATIEQDRRRAAEQLDRLVHETQEGYVRARDAVTREIDELEVRLQRYRDRIDDEV